MRTPTSIGTCNPCGARLVPYLDGPTWPCQHGHLHAHYYCPRCDRGAPVVKPAYRIIHPARGVAPVFIDDHAALGAYVQAYPEDYLEIFDLSNGDTHTENEAKRPTDAP